MPSKLPQATDFPQHHKAGLLSGLLGFLFFVDHHSIAKAWSHIWDVYGNAPLLNFCVGYNNIILNRSEISMASCNVIIFHETI